MPIPIFCQLIDRAFKSVRVLEIGDVDSEEKEEAQVAMVKLGSLFLYIRLFEERPWEGLEERIAIQEDEEGRIDH